MQEESHPTISGFYATSPKDAGVLGIEGLYHFITSPVSWMTSQLSCFQEGLISEYRCEDKLRALGFRILIAMLLSPGLVSTGWQEDSACF